MKYKVGDRVIAIGEVDGNDLKGMVGTVCHINDTFGLLVGVKFDNRIENGHSCNDYCPPGYGWYGVPEEFELERDLREKIK